MLKNNKFNMVLAVIVAIVLWAYVLGEINPASDTVIRNVPINFINQEELEKEGLTLLSSSAETVNISISGQRTSVTQIDAEDFTVTADLEALPAGESTVRLSITGPDAVKIENVNLEKVTVIIDYVATAEREISAVVTGEISQDKEAHIVQMNRNKAQITGPRTAVDKVSRLVAYIGMEQMQGQMKTFSCALIALDENGEEVEGITIDGKGKVDVTAVLFTKKTVQIEVLVINEEAYGIERKYTVPKTMVIKGTEGILSDINRIVCKTVDLKDITQSTTIALEPQLPEGVQIAEASKNLSMEVTVKQEETVTKSIELSSNNIILEGKVDELLYLIGESVLKVEISGKESIVSKVIKDDLTVSADVGELEEGTHQVLLSVSCSKDVSVVKIQPDKVEITIE